MILTISKPGNTDDRSLKGIMEGIKREVVSDALLRQCNIFTSFIFKFGKDCFRLTEESRLFKVRNMSNLFPAPC